MPFLTLSGEELGLGWLHPQEPPRLPELPLPILACLSAVPLLQNLPLAAGRLGHGRVGEWWR